MNNGAVQSNSTDIRKKRQNDASLYHYARTNARMPENPKFVDWKAAL